MFRTTMARILVITTAPLAWGCAGAHTVARDPSENSTASSRFCFSRYRSNGIAPGASGTRSGGGHPRSLPHPHPIRPSPAGSTARSVPAASSSRIAASSAMIPWKPLSWWTGPSMHPT